MGSTIEVELDQEHTNIQSQNEIVIDINNIDGNNIINYPNENFHHPTNIIQIRNNNYWKWTICAATLPFIILGLPIHLIFGKIGNYNNNDSTSSIIRNYPNPTIKWLYIIFNPIGQKLYFVLLTISLVIISAGFLMYLLLTFFTIFYHLIILGEITNIVGISILNFFRTIPGVIPIIFIWIRGYWVKNIIYSFDTLRNELQERYNLGEYDSSNIIYLPNGIFNNGKKDIRSKLICMYIIITICHIIYLLSESSGRPIGPWINYWVDIMYSLILPLYCTFCWGISSEYEFLAGHIQTFQLNEYEPTFQLFIKIKVCFKKIISHVYQINDLFRFFMSWVIPIFIFSIIIKIIYGIGFLFGYAAMKNILTTGLGIPLPDDIVNSVQQQQQQPTPIPTISPEDITPTIVRAAVGYLFVAIVQLCLLGYTIWQAVRVNDQARYLNVLLNDYGTQVSEKMTPELYQAYRILKYFIHSTMEQENSALLRLPILSCLPCFPQIRHRLQGYEIRS